MAGQAPCSKSSAPLTVAHLACGARPITRVAPGSRRRCRLPRHPWSRSCTLPDLDRRPLDRADTKSDHRRTSRCRQKLAGLRPRPQGCRDNRSVLYQRIPRVFGDLALARGDSRYPRLMRALAGVKLLMLDDWGLEPLGPEHATTCWKSSKNVAARRHADHQPDPSRPLASPDRRGDPDPRHPRPDHSQCSPTETHW